MNIDKIMTFPPFHSILITAALCLAAVGLSACTKGTAENTPPVATVSEACKELRPTETATAEQHTISFYLAPTGEQIEVPEKLQKILAERFTNPENRKRFPKTALRAIGHFHYRGEIWEWCGGRLHARHGAYHYVPELDFPKKSDMYIYMRTPRLYSSPLSPAELRKKVNRYFRAYE